MSDRNGDVSPVGPNGSVHGDHLRVAATPTDSTPLGSGDQVTRGGFTSLARPPWSSRLHEGDRILLDPGDLGRGLVEEPAASELDLPLRTSGGKLQLVLEELA